MIDSESSLRLDLLRFPLIVGVVFIHAQGTTMGFSGGEIGVSSINPLANFVINFLSEGVARIAVPLFFLMSGYLFFAGLEFSKENYVNKLKTRIQTLLIPYLFWNIATLLIFAAAQAIPATQLYFSGKHALIATFGFFDYLNALAFNRFPISGQFWFIRDLMILVLLTPIIHMMNKVLPALFLGVIFICWLMGLWPVQVPSVEALLFFSVGAYLASSGKSLFSFDKFGITMVFLYFPLVVLDTLTKNDFFNPYLHKFGIVIGVLTALFLTRLVAGTGNLKSLILQLSSASFFIFAIHYTPLIILKKILYKIFSPDTTLSILTLYFIAPIIIIMIAILAYRCLAGISPRFARIVTGGR